ncbi:hypothetical protein GQ600_480 [Phytophthora cactorum]|nr:hypothetical protein GQ600_480 [Phytophthora cactorum]
MDEFWGSDKNEAVPSKSQRQSRPSLEHRKQVKKPRSLMSIAPAPVSLAVAAPVVAPVSTSIANPVQTKGPASKTASSSPVEAVSTRAQLEDVALQTTGRPKDPSVESAGLSKLGNLIDDRFGKVLEGQGKQLKLAEEQNQLLTRILATLQRNQHHDHT